MIESSYFFEEESILPLTSHSKIIKLPIIYRSKIDYNNFQEKKKVLMRKMELKVKNAIIDSIYYNLTKKFQQACKEVILFFL